MVYILLNCLIQQLLKTNKECAYIALLYLIFLVIRQLWKKVQTKSLKVSLKWSSKLLKDIDDCKRYFLFCQYMKPLHYKWLLKR